MKAFFAFLITQLLMISAHSSAVACDPDENCRACILGTCTNDPFCEARKVACRTALRNHIPIPGQIPIPSPVPTIPGVTSGPVLPGTIPLPITTGLDAKTIRACISNLNRCPQVVLGHVGYSAVKPIVDSYIAALAAQAGDRLSPLDEQLIAKIQPYYSVDLHGIRYATGINTIHGQNITIVNTVYFIKGVNFHDPNDAWLLYHELQHSVQYANRGGLEPFMAEYILKAGGSILRGGKSIDMHDNIDLERDADAKANQVAAAVPSEAPSVRSVRATAGTKALTANPQIAGHAKRQTAVARSASHKRCRTSQHSTQKCSRRSLKRTIRRRLGSG